MRSIKTFFLSSIILLILWLVLGGVHIHEILIGGISAVVISLLLNSQLRILGDIKLNPRAFLSSIAFIFVFLIELFKSAIDVASRVISPSLPINPGIVKVRTKLKSPLGRIVLANAITMTPGTMTVETRGEFLYIHWIDMRADNIEAATEAIVSVFERHLEVIFG